MHKSLSIPLLTLIFVTATAFKQEDGKERGSFEALINETPFDLREGQMLRGLLVNRNASMDGKIPARTVISTSFQGQSYSISESKQFTESIHFEIAYDSLKLTGTPSYFAVALQYKSDKYYLVKEESELTITKLDWEADKKHFRLSVDYKCKMRKWGSADAKSDVSLTGKLTDIRITVPSWIAPKN